MGPIAWPWVGESSVRIPLLSLCEHSELSPQNQAMDMLSRGLPETSNALAHMLTFFYCRRMADRSHGTVTCCPVYLTEESRIHRGSISLREGRFIPEPNLSVHRWFAQLR